MFYNLSDSLPRLFQFFTHIAEIFRYAVSGVRKSDGIVAHKGTRFGGLGDLSKVESTSCTCSNEG